MPITERDEIATQMHDRGENPDIVHELTEEGFSELKNMLKTINALEKASNELSRDNTIKQFLEEEKQQLKLRYKNLPKDPVRVLMKRSKYLSRNLRMINGHITNAMYREDSEDQVENLRNDGVRVEEELKQIREDLNRLLKND